LSVIKHLHTQGNLARVARLHGLENLKLQAMGSGIIELLFYVDQGVAALTRIKLQLVYIVAGPGVQNITHLWRPVGNIRRFAIPLDRGPTTASQDKKTEYQAGFQIAHGLPFFYPLS
jgi:hypothetical protein